MAEPLTGPLVELAGEADEGTAAHIFQVLLIAQVPIVAFFAIKWLPRNPPQALPSGTCLDVHRSLDGPMSESWRTRIERWKFNLVPAYRGTGGRVTHIRHDWSEVRVTVPLSWRTRNYVGTIYGGSLYGAVDPIYMLMLMKLLGPDYVVWDKAATIRFRRPARTRLTATFRLSPELVVGIREELTRVAKLDRVFTVELIDRAGVVYAMVEKTVHVSRRSPRSPG